MPGSESQDAKNGKKEETTASGALTFIYVLWPVEHIYIHTHTQKQHKEIMVTFEKIKIYL